MWFLFLWRCEIISLRVNALDLHFKQHYVAPPPPTVHEHSTTVADTNPWYVKNNLQYEWGCYKQGATWKWDSPLPIPQAPPAAKHFFFFFLRLHWKTCPTHKQTCWQSGWQRRGFKPLAFRWEPISSLDYLLTQTTHLQPITHTLTHSPR